MLRSIRRKRPPGPRVGLVRHLVGRIRGRRRTSPLDFLREAALHGDLVYWRFGPYGTYLAVSPELVTEVLVARSGEFLRTRKFQRALAPFFGKALLISDGSHHRKRRRQISPAFHGRHLEGHARVAFEAASEWLGSVSPGERDLEAELSRLAVRITARALFGGEVGAEADRIADLVTALQPHAKAAVQGAPGLRARTRRARLLREVDATLAALVERAGEGNALIRDLRRKHVVGPRELRTEVFSLLAAGQEATSSVVSLAARLLTGSPGWYRRIEREADEVLGAHGTALSRAGKLVETERVIKETLRLYPPGWITLRSPSASTSLGGYRLRKGAIVAVSAWVSHRSPRWFESPDEFRPERWTAAFEKSLPSGVYLPFGAGPHTCIGQALGTVETKLILAMLVRRFRISAPREAPIRLQPGITLRPKGGVRLRLEPRA